jgi:hypothetical protein
MNIANTKSKEAVELPKQVCQSKADPNTCKGISPKDMSNEELLSERIGFSVNLS